MSIVVKDLNFVYSPKSPFEKHALVNVNLTVDEGDFLAIIGHTGSGKSTFVQHLNGLVKLQSGKIIVDGIDLSQKKIDYKKLRGTVGMVFQYPEYQLFAETVEEDVAFGLSNFAKDLSEEEKTMAVKEALKMVGLDYNAIGKRSPFELSGGQKRRVAIAGVIVTKPEILILDEPAAGLDPKGKEEVMQLLHKLHNAWCKTVIIVSHDMDEITENCTRAAIFSGGNVLSIGEPKVLFSQTEKIQKAGLDIPFTAKTSEALKKKGIVIDCDYTVSDFVEKTLEFAKTLGAGMRSTEKGGV